MLLIRSLDGLKGQFTKVSVALGTFDGVHLAHRYVIGKAVERARNQRGTSMVFTFANHPGSVINPSRVPPQIQSMAAKTEQIRNLGVDVLVRIPFTKQLLHVSPEDFVQLLVEKINPCHLVIGPNYSFGDKGAGTPTMLTEFAGRYGIETEICPEIHENGVMVSSTAIRRLLAAGSLADASRLLGRLFEINGRVIHGDSRGRTLGFPTANLLISDQLLLPAKGVYAVRVQLGAHTMNGLCSIGTNPTFLQNQLRVEVHILDFDREIYGKNLRVQFLGRLRGEHKFSNVEALIAQMHQDIVDANRSFFVPNVEWPIFGIAGKLV